MASTPAGSPGRNRARWLFPALGYLLSLAALIWVYWGFDWKMALTRFAASDWRWVAFSMIASVCIYLCQAWRWSLLLRPVGRAPFWRSLQSIFIGLFANEVLPLRSGELIRGYVQARWTGIPFSVVLSSEVVERLFDGILLAIGSYLTMQFVEVPRYLRNGSVVLAAVVAVFSVLLAVIMFHKQRAHAAVARSRWAKALWHVVEGLHAMGNSRWFLTSAAVSVIFLGIQVVPVWALMRACNMELSFGVAAVVLVILRLGTIIPQAPSNVGGFQLFTVAALRLFDVDKAVAAEFATIMFFAVTIPLWICGAIAAALAGTHIRDLQRHAQASLQPAATGPSEGSKP